MRTTRANTDLTAKFFHVESEVAHAMDAFTPEEASDYHALFQTIATIYGYTLPLIAIHPRGFHLVVQLKAQKNISPLSDEMAQAFHDIGECDIAVAIQTNNFDSLHQVTHQRYLRYKSNCQDIQRFIQTCKQRISLKYNQKRSRKGAIWAGRAKFHSLQNRSKDFLEVVAFIMASSYAFTKDSKAAWPTFHRHLEEGDAQTRDALNQLLKKDLSAEKLSALLKEAQVEIEEQMKKPMTPSGKKHRGRQASWRPECERRESVTPTKPTAEYTETRQRAHARFHDMLKRYRKFKQQTGLDRIPVGYREDPELRIWARTLRGKHRQGRLPQWQVDKLQGSGILEPSIPHKEWSKLV